MHPMRRAKGVVLGWLIGVSAVLPAMMPQPALAQNNAGGLIGGILGLIVSAAIIDSAKKSWANVDPDVRSCLTTRFNIYPDNLANNGISAEDRRVTPYLNICQQAQAQLEAARQSWADVGEPVRACLRVRFNVYPDNLANQGITASDGRVASVVQTCTQLMAQIKIARDGWATVPPEIVACLRTKFSSDPDTLAGNGVAPADPSAASMITSCSQSIAARKKLLAEYGPDMMAAIDAHEVRMGMTKDAVRESRGDPMRIDRVPPDEELWHYDQLEVVFTKNKVTYFGK